MNPFQKWVRDFGGPDRLAVALGVSSWAVRVWLTRKGYPKVDNMREMIRLSKKQLTYEIIINGAAPLKGRQ